MFPRIIRTLELLFPTGWEHFLFLRVRELSVPLEYFFLFFCKAPKSSLIFDNAMTIKSWFQLLFETMLERFLSPARRASTDTWSTWIPSQILFSDATSCHNVHVSQSFSFCSAMSKLSCVCRWSVMLSFGHRANQGGCASSTLNGRVYTVTS